MKVAVIPIEICELGTILEGLVKEMGDLEITGQVETIQTTTLFRSARILRRIPRARGYFAITQTPRKEHRLTLV